MSIAKSEQGSVRPVFEHFQDIQNRKHAEAIDDCHETISEQGSAKSVFEHFQDIQNRKHAEMIDDCLEIISDLEEEQEQHKRIRKEVLAPRIWLYLCAIGLLASGYVIMYPLAYFEWEQFQRLVVNDWWFVITFPAARIEWDSWAIWGFFACLFLLAKAYRRNSRTAAAEEKTRNDLEQARHKFDSMVRLAEGRENKS